jgi:hypothetical protein
MSLGWAGHGEQEPQRGILSPVLAIPSFSHCPVTEKLRPTNFHPPSLALWYKGSAYGKPTLTPPSPPQDSQGLSGLDQGTPCPCNLLSWSWQNPSVCLPLLPCPPSISFSTDVCYYPSPFLLTPTRAWDTNSTQGDKDPIDFFPSSTCLDWASPTQHRGEAIRQP